MQDLQIARIGSPAAPLIACCGSYPTTHNNAYSQGTNTQAVRLHSVHDAEWTALHKAFTKSGGSSGAAGSLCKTAGNCTFCGKGRSHAAGSTKVFAKALNQQDAASPQEATPATDVPKKGSTEGTMIILDAMALLYRSHYAQKGSRRLVSNYGEDTTALYGFLRSFFLLLKGPPAPTHCVVVLDSGGATHRHAIDEQYKASREACPAEVSWAANRLRVLLPLVGVPVVKEVGWEADDLIGSLAVHAAEEGLHVAVASPDKDFLQLLRPGVDLLRMGAGDRFGDGGDKYSARYTHTDFLEDYELDPPLYAHVLALAGDSVDGIPGLPGIGPKTAVTLLKQFGSVQGVLEGAEQVRRKVPRQALLAPGAQQLALRCLELTTIRTDLVGELPSLQQPPCGWRLMHTGEEGWAAAEAEFEGLGFRSLTSPLRQHLKRVERLWHAS